MAKAPPFAAKGKEAPAKGEAPKGNPFAKGKAPAKGAKASKGMPMPMAMMKGK